MYVLSPLTLSTCVFLKKKNHVIYFWLLWVFVAACWVSLMAVKGATLFCCAQASHCGGFSCCGAPVPGTWASVLAAQGLSSCGVWALELMGFSSCVTGAQ